MKNKALLAAFIFLAFCICYSRSQTTSLLFHLLYYGRYATKEAIMKGYECLLNNSSVTEHTERIFGPTLYINCLEHFIPASRYMVLKFGEITLLVCFHSSPRWMDKNLLRMG
ncbi:uncharacterized protein LOC143243678 isoform X2 [Tachypleus tridentatus]|uniref:uncharacterized protein LOC143243678 isoform X2 n=1 Tax=Tachypleus tridentatus TaxID=6853 RepID=UPI003FD02159